MVDLSIVDPSLEDVIEQVFTRGFGDTPAGIAVIANLARIHLNAFRAQFRASLAVQFQYRTSQVIWLLFFVLQPAIYLSMLVSIKRVDVWKLVDAGLGLVLLVLAVVQLDQRVGPAQAAGFVLTLVAGGATIYSCCLILATLAFWFIRVDNVLIVLLTFWEAGRWPVDVYPLWLRTTLTFLVPVAFATTVPAQALSGRLTPSTLLVAIAVAGALLAISRVVWLRGLHRYSGASA